MTTQTELCKYGQEPKSCTSSPMDCQCALDATFAQQEQEPVACIGYWNQKTGAYYKPDQISAAHQKLIEDGILRRCYITSPQRKPLTDEEIFSIWRKHTDLDAVRHTPYEDDGIGFARAIEAAHGIKGGA